MRHVEHRIDNEDATPIRLSPRRIPIQYQHQFNQMAGDMLNKLSAPPWTSPVVLVKKPDDSLRLCVDYQLSKKAK
ncbi:hypothetical protein T265_00655 [Opisthorchis viverrini]|uniref:Reverse transcriptase domain-containing protein n=1 Tax=Opisthorchis viverrini TaxID=6198 RepID=A0A075A1D5_OPIVI|nr:hypothetical protein T265_00655 [Opisthorchis viverrini]KER33548.1 hypothetical protein T265_00655 [Opisthorchis viverrini]